MKVRGYQEQTIDRKFDRFYLDVSRTPKKCDGKQGVVYILEGKKKIKIGSTIKPLARIRAIRSAGGEPLGAIFISDQCLNYREVEQALHRKLRRCRDIGEWFKCDMVFAVYHLRLVELEHEHLDPEAESRELAYWADNICRNKELIA